MTLPIPPEPPPQNSPSRVLDLELLALDLGTCTRCVGTLANIEAAIQIVRPVLAVTGTSVRVETIIVGSEDEARRHRFTSSPTIRIDGRDIVLDTLESRCEPCTDLCGCDEGTSCRVWRYQDQEHTEAPVGLVAEALLRGVFGGAAAGVATASVASAQAEVHEVPENLRRFFAAKAARRGAEASPCCSSSDHANCCDPAEKDACCGGSEPSSCGCR